MPKTDIAPELRFETTIPDQDACLVGVIRLVELHERFAATVGVWAVEEYRAHWRERVRAAAAGESVAVITDWRPSAAPDGVSGTAWTLHRRPDRVAIQQSLLLNAVWFPDGLATVERVAPRPYSATNEDGARLSEWSATPEEIARLAAWLEA